MPKSVQPSLIEVPEPARRVDTAQVLVDAQLAHLDHTFDYEIPAAMLEKISVGVRVKVRFAGQDRDGFVVSIKRQSQQVRQLAPIRKVVSDLPVLTQEVLRLCQAVADHYGGTTMDVLRLAVPPRHARVEKSVREEAAGSQAAADAAISDGTDHAPDAEDRAGVHASDEAALQHRAQQLWQPYLGGGAFLKRLATSLAPRAAWMALPHPPAAESGAPAHWALAIAAAVHASVIAGKGAIVCVPQQRDIAAVEAALAEFGITPALLGAQAGPAPRYRNFLQLLLGRSNVVVGTRSAAFAPVERLGLLVCWDDGDDLHQELRAPYPHVREVIRLRAEEVGAGVLFGSFGRSVAAQHLVATGWVRELRAPRDVIRAATPRVIAPSQQDNERDGSAGFARIPPVAFRILREALSRGPALVQVPLAGYVLTVACAQCREAAHCKFCHGPLHIDESGKAPLCSWCSKPQLDWHCPHCESASLRARRIGSERTAEELGRAFPGVRLRSSNARAGVIESVDGGPQLVVATPGAEPSAESGYFGGVLLDGHALASRPELGADIEALRRWLHAGALVRSDAQLLLLGALAPALRQALVRWDGPSFAARALAERTELDFPPVVRMAAISGDAGAVAQCLRSLQLPESAEVLGPVAVGERREDRVAEVRALIRAPLVEGEELARALKHMQALRSARRMVGTVTIHMDPTTLV